MQQQEQQGKQERDNPVIVKFRQACLEKGCGGIKSIGRAFQRADKDNSDCLSYSEFMHVAQFYQGTMTQNDMKELYTMFDKDKNGTINYSEFLYYLRPPLSKARLDLIKKAYQKFDVTGDGKVDMTDLQQKYDVTHHPKYKSGDWTKKQVLQEFMNNYQGEDRDDVITYDEFYNYYCGVSASIDKDVYFDFMMRQSWKL